MFDFDALVDDINDIQDDTFGRADFTINGHRSVRGIFDEGVDEFAEVDTTIISLEVQARNLPKGTKTGHVVQDAKTGRNFKITGIPKQDQLRILILAEI